MKTKLTILFVFALVLCGAQNAQAENYDDGIVNEVSFSYGALSSSGIISIFNHVWDGLFGAKYDNSSFIGPISAEYFYHVSPVFGVGVIGVFSREKEDVIQNNEVCGEQTSKFITVMPAVKFNWLRRSNWGLYSKAAFGYSRANYNTTGKDSDGKTIENKSHCNYANFQASLIGVEAGSANVRGFAEAGFGEQGMFLAGLRFRF